MFLPLFLTGSLMAQAQSWPNVTEGLPRSTEGGNDAAVIVGISDYFQIADVPGAVDNAMDWRRTLERRGVPLENSRLLANGEAMLEEARWASGRAKAGGKVWFVYIGPRRAGAGRQGWAAGGGRRAGLGAFAGGAERDPRSSGRDLGFRLVRTNP